HQFEQAGRILLGADFILEIGDAEDQAVAPALSVESDQARIPAEAALMPLVGQRIGILLARRIQQEEADDGGAQNVSAYAANQRECRAGPEKIARNGSRDASAVPRQSTHASCLS